MKTKISLLTSSLFLLIQLCVSAQPPTRQWDARFGGNGSDHLFSLQQTSDNGYILGGTSDSPSNGDKSQNSWGSSDDYWAVKTDDNGIKQWDVRFGGTDADELRAVIQTEDGGFLLGGLSGSGISGNKTQAGQGSSDYWIVKTDVNGVKQWDARFGGTSNDELTSLLQTTDGGYILGGSSNSNIGGDKTQASQGVYDYWIVKTDANGIKQLDFRYGGSSFDYLESLQPTSDGGYILGGTSSSGISGDKTQTSWSNSDDYWIVKINASGIKQWDARFGGNKDDNLYTVQQTTDDGYILGGQSLSAINGDKTQTSQGGSDYWIIKTDANGIKQWDRRYGGSSTDQFKSLQQVTDGGYIFGGYSASGISGDKTQAIWGVRDFWIVKTDGAGVKQWDIDFGGTDWDQLESIAQTADGGFIAGGYSDSPISGDKSQASWNGTDDFWVVKTSSTDVYTLAVGAISLSYLPGEQVNIPYTASGPFNGGNVFTAELSSNSGSFELPVVIGSVNSTTSGTINAVIPASTPYGTFYRIRVASSDAVVISYDNDEDITIGTFIHPPVKLWDVRYGGNLGDQLKAMLQTDDGGYLLGGDSYSDISGDKTQPNWGGFYTGDYWIVKTDANGEKQWDLRYGGTKEEYLTSLQSTSDGGYLLGGFSNSGKNGDKTQGNRGGYDYWIVKIDADGTKEWDKRFGGSEDDYLQSFILTSDGGYLLGGYSHSGVSGDKTEPSQGDHDYWIVKTDGNGFKQWDKSFGGNDSDELFALEETTDGGFFLGGYSYSGVSGDKTNFSRGGSDYWIVKTDAGGIKEWDRTFGGSEDDILTTLESTGDGGYIAGGYSFSSATGDKSQINQGLLSTSDYWIVKINASGVKKWDATFGGDEEEFLYALKITPDGGLILGGWSDSGISGDRTQSSRGSTDYWSVKTNAEGIKQWDVRFGGSDVDRLHAIIQTEDGEFVLGGYTQSPISGDVTVAEKGSWDFWIVKTDAGGTLTCNIPTGAFTSDITATSAKTNWSEVATANKYNVRYRITGADTWTKVSATTTNKKLKDLSPNTPYDWQVKSICSDLDLENSNWSSTQNFTTNPLRLAMEEITFEVYPNPFSFSTTISFSLEENSHTTIELFDLAGRKIETLLDENLAEGDHQVNFSVRSPSDNRESRNAGIYFVKLKTDEGVITKKIVIE